MKFELPDYEIGHELGTGGMASVYRARHIRLDRQVALKVMHPELTRRDTDFSERFLREARIAADLSHPNIVQVYDVNLHGKNHFIAMEFISGGDLKERLEKPVDRDELLHIVDQITRGLDYAHSRGYIHRDIKPANILFRESGEAVVSDFGIARAIDSNTHLTKTGSVIGTPTYMSPEQASGVTIDGRSDLYSVAVIVFEILTGTVPYVGETSLSIAIKHISEPIPTLPKALKAVQPFIDKGMAKDPNDRFNNGSELLDMLQDALDQLTVDDVNATKTLLLVRPGESKTRAGKTTALRPRRNTPITTDNDKTLLRSISHLKPQPKILGALAIVLVVLIGAGFWLKSDRINKNQQLQIQQLLSAAQADIDAGRLYQPANGNALDKYQTAQAIAEDYPATVTAIAALNTALLQQSAMALSRDDWSLAEEYAQQVLKLSPGNDDAEQQLQTINELREQQQQAIQQQLTAANQAASAQQWQQAIAGFKQFKKLYGTSPELTQAVSDMASQLLSNGKAASNQQLFDQAEQLLELANDSAAIINNSTLASAINSARNANSRQRSAVIRQQKVQQLLSQAKSANTEQQAARLYQQVLALEPQNSTANSGLVRATDALIRQTEQSIGRGDLARASSTLSQLESAMPLNSTQRQKTADLRNQLKVYRAQQADLDKLFDRFDRYMQAPKVTSADKIYRRIEIINYKHPRLPDLKRQLADGYLQLAQKEAQADDWGDAITWCNKGLEFVPEDPQLKALLAQSIEKRKTTDRKLLDFFR